jgi:hypothetical protein
VGGLLGCVALAAAPALGQSAEGLPEPLQAAFEAHGGLDTWQQYGTLEYDLDRRLGDTEGQDRQTIDLQDRRVRIDADAYTIGYDGEQVWITPSKDALTYGAPPRFYSQTYFYFFAIPFVFADPGVNAESLGPRTLDGETYDVVRITYGENVGDSPDDQYVAYFDADAHRLHLVLYTVTYGPRTQEQPRSALVYEEWQTVGGLRVPKTARYYRWTGDGLGQQVGEATFADVEFREARPPSTLFRKPDDAVIDRIPGGQ